MLTRNSHPFRPGDLVVHRHPNRPATAGILFGAGPRHVAAVTADRVHITIEDEDATFAADDINFAPAAAVTDPLGRRLIVVQEVEPAPSAVMTRVAKSGAREWVPTNLLTLIPTEPELTLWGTRSSGSTITWWHDEFSARHAAAKGPSVEVITMTGRPVIVDRSPAVGHLALVDTDELRRALAAGPSAIATLISQLGDKSDFLADVEEALRTPGGISRLIADHRGTTD